MPRIPKNQNHINRHHAADDVGECYGVGWTSRSKWYHRGRRFSTESERMNANTVSQFHVTFHKSCRIGYIITYP